MAQYTKTDTNTASQMMWEAACGGDGAFVSGACGEEHTLPDDITEEMYDAGEYESIEYVALDGQYFVWDCPKCSEKLARYESFIWNNRETIRKYLKIRVDQEKAWADQEKLLNTIAGI